MYQAERKPPSLLDRIKPYKSYIILVAIAVVIVATRATLALTGIYWVLIIGLLIAAAALWLRGRQRTKPYSPQNRYSAPRSGPNPGPGPSAVPPRKKHANVIPFRKKADSKMRNVKRD